MYDNLPLCCNYCKQQSHGWDICCLIKNKNKNNKQIDNIIEVALKGTTDSDKYQGDVREMVNEKWRIVDIDQSKTTSLHRQLDAATTYHYFIDKV